MATFEEIVRRTNQMAARVAEATGVSKPLVLNIISYAKSLPHPDTPEEIDELVFKAQLGLRFDITSVYHVQLMYEALRHPKSLYVHLEDYVKTIATFISPIMDVKIKFVFQVYDFTRNGFINVKDCSSMLKSCLLHFGEDDPNEQQKEFIEMVMNFLDKDQEGGVDLDHFREFVRRDILCLEMFGKVLPSEAALKSFRELLEKNSPQQLKLYFNYERQKCLFEPVHIKTNALYPGVILDLP